MKKGFKIVIGIVMIFSVAIPTTFLIYKNAYEQIKFELHDIILDDVREIRFLNIPINYVFDLRLNMTIESPTGIPLNVDGGTFKIEFDDIKVSNGVFGAFTAVKEPSPFLIETNITISFDLWRSIANFVLGNDVNVKFTILNVIIFGNTLSLNRVKEDTINLEDFTTP